MDQIREMSRRVEQAFWQAYSDDVSVRLGTVWYQGVKSMAADMHPSVEAGCGVIAALSPRNTFKVNVRDAAKLCKIALSGSEIAPKVAGIYRNRDKAWKIARGEYRESPLELLNSDPAAFKVNHFYRNLMGDYECVTVDVWAARVACPEFAGASVRGGFYKKIEAAYQEASARIGWLRPAQVQASVWCSVRGGGE